MVAVYTYDPQGDLTFVRVVPDAGAAPCWAVVNHAGTRLYVTNTGDNSIEVYSLTDPLNPTELQHFVMDPNNGGAVFSTVIDHSDGWLYVSAEYRLTVRGLAQKCSRIPVQGTIRTCACRMART
jgi:DNA-binding beta-propeller fold protein YncE